MSEGMVSSGRSPTCEWTSDVEHLVAAAAVGDRRLGRVLLSYRSCSRGLKAAVDEGVRRWCSRFAELQQEHVLLCARPRGCERVYEVEARLDELAARAFGNTESARAFVGISRVSSDAYFACLRGVCMLCGARLSAMASMADSECFAPCYAIAHEQCQRKHMVIVPVAPRRVAPIPGIATGGRDGPQAQLAAVAAYCDAVPEIARDVVIEKLSPWYKARMPAAPLRGGIAVWLQEHPLVSDPDTLYGALGVSATDAREAVRRRDERLREYRNSLQERRRVLLRKTEQLSAAHEGELRLWLGRGRTRWRSIEQLAAFHEDMLASTMVDRLISPVARRRPSGCNVATICNSLLLLSRALDLAGTVSPAVLDWLVGCATVSCLFGQSSYELQFVDADRMSEAVNNEARVAASVLEAVEGMRGVHVRCERARCVSAPDAPSVDRVEFSLALHLGDIRATHAVGLQLADALKLKFRVAAAAASPQRLPPLPDATCPQAREQLFAEYFNCMLHACLREEAGMARAVMLRLVLPASSRLVLEIAHSCRFSGMGEWSA